MTRSLALLALVASLPGCILVFGDDTKDCDMMAVSSVSVSVSAADGGDVSSAVVSYAVDGGAFRPCEGYPGDGEFTCGWEEAGSIVVRVEAVGYETAERTVFVEQDVCHVIPERVAVDLAPMDVDCTDVELPSVMATVAGSGGEALEGVSVHWGYRDADMAPQPCDPMSDGRWACGWEVPGDLEVYAEASGHAGEMASVHVTADECHVRTESVEFALDWLPD